MEALKQKREVLTFNLYLIPDGPAQRTFVEVTSFLLMIKIYYSIKLFIFNAKIRVIPVMYSI